MADVNYDVPVYQVGRGPNDNYERIAFELTEEHAVLIANALNSRESMIDILRRANNAFADMGIKPEDYPRTEIMEVLKKAGVA